jgi:hypothetical protein
MGQSLFDHGSSNASITISAPTSPANPSEHVVLQPWLKLELHPNL